jgi:hypothetical protein
MECFAYCANFCSLLSCVGDVRNAFSKLCPCIGRKKEAVPEYHEEIVKIVFLGKTILRFEKIEETKD